MASATTLSSISAANTRLWPNSTSKPNSPSAIEAGPSPHSSSPSSRSYNSPKSNNPQLNRTNLTITAQSTALSLTLVEQQRNNLCAALFPSPLCIHRDLRSPHGHRRPASTSCPAASPRRATAPRRRRPLLLLAQASLAHRHRPHRRLSHRAHRLQLRGRQRPPRLRQTGPLPQLPPARPCPRVDPHLHPPRLPRALRRLHRHPRPQQRQRLPLGRQLDVSLPASHRPHRLRLHLLSRLDAALLRCLSPRAPRCSLCQGPARACEPLDTR